MTFPGFTEYTVPQARTAATLVALPAVRARSMLARIFQPKPLDEPAHTRSAFSYSQLDLALLSLCAQAVAYYAKTGHWPRLAPHDTSYAEVWPQ